MQGEPFAALLHTVLVSSPHGGSDCLISLHPLCVCVWGGGGGYQGSPVRMGIAVLKNSKMFYFGRCTAKMQRNKTVKSRNKKQKQDKRV